MIEVNEKENHTEEKTLEEREGPERAPAYYHTEPSGLTFWYLAQQWVFKASAEGWLSHRSSPPFGVDVQDRTRCNDNLDNTGDYRSVTSIFPLKFKMW